VASGAAALGQQSPSGDNMNILNKNCFLHPKIIKLFT
jgi:hypothetical protein